MKVLLTIPLSRFSGYGNDGIGLTRALVRAGADVYIRPKVVQAPLPADIAQLLTKGLRAPFDLTITHLDPAALQLPPDTRASSKICIAWSMWEYTDFSFMRGRSKLRENLRDYDAVVGYDEVTNECFRPYYRGPILKQQGGYEPEGWEYLERNWNSEDFYFSMVGAPLSIRKNPLSAVKAFGELKNENSEFDKHARLMLKTTPDDKGLSPKMEDVYPGLRVFADTWTPDILKEFYRNTHVLLAPSRGEGKHMPSLEIQSTGAPVIATNWGGMTEWLSPEYSYPVDYRLSLQDPINKSMTNAEVSVPHLKELMLHAFQNRDEVRHKGFVASQIIPQLCSWENVVGRLMGKLRDLEGGEELWARYQIALSEAEDGDD